MSRRSLAQTEEDRVLHKFVEEGRAAVQKAISHVENVMRAKKVASARKVQSRLLAALEGLESVGYFDPIEVKPELPSGDDLAIMLEDEDITKLARWFGVSTAELRKRVRSK
jgi:hypothetical protein